MRARRAPPQIQAERARARWRGPRSCGESLRHGVRDFFDADGSETPVGIIEPALTFVVALAPVVPRQRKVLIAPGPVPGWIRRAEQTDRRRTDGRSNVERPGVPGNEERGRA